MWCVVADNGDEFWVYGMFASESDARTFAEKHQTESEDRFWVEYNAAQFLQAEEYITDGKQENNPAT